MNQLLITTAFGLEDLLIREIKTLLPELKCTQKPGQIHCLASLPDAYTICLWSRLANRVLLSLNEGRAESGDEIYQLAADIDWTKHFTVDNTFAVDFFGTNHAINNTQFGALKIKDAIVDTFSRHQSVRPNVDKSNPQIRIQGRLHRDKAAIYLDMSGASLHQRHYRQAKGTAPIRENLAFAMLMRSGWTENTNSPLCDPMCGSGTIVIEAAQYKCGIAPGISRETWGFSHWRKHDEAVWQEIHNAAVNCRKDHEGKIVGNDINGRLISIAKENAEAAGVAECITFSKSDVVRFAPNIQDAGYLVCNSPYGERMGELAQLFPLFQQWGSHLKQQFAHWQLAILSSNRDLLKQLKLASNKAYKLKNANLDCELLLYKMDERNCSELKHSAKLDGDFANRLRKNWQKTQRWLKHQNTNCYRIYDADLPEYNVAIDRYADWIVIQEYAAPRDIPEQKTNARLQEVLLAAPQILDVPATKVVLKVREVKKGKSQYEKVSRQSELIKVHENGADFWVNLHDYLDTGLFLDHREIRVKVRELSKGKRVLNLFAYTGSVSVYAAQGGAKSVTTVDMSNTYLDWAKRNFQLNNLRGEHQFVRADVTSWLQKQHDKYDLIFIDPPSFSNSKSMDDTWDVQRDHAQLIGAAKNCLAEHGTIIFSNNFRNFKLDKTIETELQLQVKNITASTIPDDFKRNAKIHHCWFLTADE